LFAKIALHANIGQHDITILYLVPGMVAVFNKIAFAGDCTDNSKSAAWDDTLICKLNSNIFFMVTSGMKHFLIIPVYHK